MPNADLLVKITFSDQSIFLPLSSTAENLCPSFRQDGLCRRRLLAKRHAVSSTTFDRPSVVYDTARLPPCRRN